MSNYPPPGGYPPAGGSYPPPGQQPPGQQPPGWTPPGQGPGAPGPGGPGSGQWPPSGPPPPQQGPWQQPPPGGYGYSPGGYGGYGQNMRTAPKAGWFTRLGALLIDAIILALLFLPAVIYLTTGPTEITTCSVDSEGTIQFGEPDNAICEGPTGATWAVSSVLGIAAFAGVVAYWAILDGKRGQSIGKKALNIKVVDANSGQVIGAGRGVGRYFARILSGFFCGLGYLWAIWDEQHQAWHDKLVNSVVVPA